MMADKLVGPGFENFIDYFMPSRHGITIALLLLPLEPAISS